MLDFVKIKISDRRINKWETHRTLSFELYSYGVKDIMIKGGDFYAWWDERNNCWSTSETELLEYLDAILWEKYEEEKKKLTDDDKGIQLIPLTMREVSSGQVKKFHDYVKREMRDNFHQLDQKIHFASDENWKREDYATKRLPYKLAPGDTPGWDRLLELYSDLGAQTIQWYVGAIISGEFDKVQKCLVLYGEPGSGKSTILNAISKVFGGKEFGYVTNFSSKDLGNKSDQFSTASFKNNPPIAIDQDGDLSRMDDNTKLNKIISHDAIDINDKNVKKFPIKPTTALFIATNNPIKITDSKSGMLRRILDITPNGNRIPRKEYDHIMDHMLEFEYGAIAYKCLEVYKKLGRSYYDSYIPLGMMAETNDFYNFMETYMYDFIRDDYVTLGKAWSDYKSYCLASDVRYPMSMREVRIELKNYFKTYEDRKILNGERLRSVYSEFRKEKFVTQTEEQARGLDDKPLETWIKFDKHTSIFDVASGDYPAQLANEDGKPRVSWADVNTKLSDIDTSKLHYVRVPQNHIVIDFDIKDETGKKSFIKNLEAASKFPPTYAELSKSESGIHLHYIYDGDVSQLSSIYGDDIEVKVFRGRSSLRRMLTRCNNLQIATINSGLPLKENKKVIDEYVFKTDTELLNRIAHVLKTGKPHGHHKPNMDYIKMLTDKAYEQGLMYDVECMRKSLHNYAMASRNQRDVCLKMLSEMHLRSENAPDNVLSGLDKPLVFYDVEVFPNLFLINWKYIGKENPVVRMINPTPEEVRELSNNNNLIGFNNRRYDNHILYGRMTGMSNMELYSLSQKLINGTKDAFFRNAYNLSYTDIYDYSKKKQSLKKWEIQLGIHHKELGMDWNKPVPEDRWHEVAEYCDNDVIATEAVWEATQADFTARQIISELSGLTVNDTTNTHTGKIVFGNDKHPQSEFIYTDLSEEFPTYKFENGRSSYRNEYIGEGGYVWEKPGMYFNVKVFDVASMHPHTIKALTMFGEKYTKRYFDLVEARIAIKHGDYKKLETMFEGKLIPYLKDKTMAKQLSEALKIVINSVYGLTSAPYDNLFKDPRNVDNICAKRGELFMMTLRDDLVAMGAQVVHIKTDSIKVVDPSPEIENYIYEMGKKYGYEFEVENIYERFCLVNGSTYIAKHADGTYKIEENPSGWEAKAAQFAQPYVFKTLFSKEPIIFDDMCETKSVKTAISIDFNESLPEGEHDYYFVGKVGLFCPIISGAGGGLLVAEREDKKNGGIKYDAVTGTKGYRWMESETVKENGLEDKIDRSYYIRLVDEARDTISKYGDFEMFVG